MGWQGKLRHQFEVRLGLYIFESLPRGVRWDVDFKTDFQNYTPQLIVDVGANVGQSAKYFNKYFPTTKILSFEPVPETYLELVANVDGIDNVHCQNLGFGNEIGSAYMDRSDAKETASIVEDTDLSENCVKVKIDTIDNYCAESGVDKIDFLKIDTEGYDLNVLKGASDMLIEGKINFVEVETGMNATNKLHVPFEEVKQYLEQKNFHLYGIYEQVRENPRKYGAYLRRSNATYIQRDLKL